MFNWRLQKAAKVSDHPHDLQQPGRSGGLQPPKSAPAWNQGDGLLLREALVMLAASADALP